MMLACGRRLDRPGSMAPVVQQLMLEAGIVDVVETQYKRPTNSLPEDTHLKRVGYLEQEERETWIEAAGLAIFTRILGYTVEDLNGFLPKLRACIGTTTIHAYWPPQVESRSGPRLSDPTEDCNF